MDGQTDSRMDRQTDKQTESKPILVFLRIQVEWLNSTKAHLRNLTLVHLQKEQGLADWTLFRFVDFCATHAIIDGTTDKVLATQINREHWIMNHFKSY